MAALQVTVLNRLGLPMTIHQLIHEKRHRLPRSCYQGMVCATFTCCIKDRKPAFLETETVVAVRDCLKRAIGKHAVKNWLYVFMPDHLHFILEGQAQDSDLWQAIYSFKTSSGMWFPRHRPDIKWQKDYYDYIHREEGDLDKHIGYLLENPIRAGLVADWSDYPYSGSLDYDLMEVV